MSLRVIAIDLGTIAAITIIGTVMATQSVPVEDWRIWLKGMGWGIAYRTLPEAMQYVVLFRAQYLPDTPIGPPPLPEHSLVIPGRDALPERDDAEIIGAQ